MNAVERLLPTGSRQRAAAVSALSVVAFLILTQLILPGSKGGGRGTPAAVLFNGLCIGMVTSLTAAGIVLIYRTNRFFNFAQPVIGAAGGLLAFNLIRFTPVPFVLAVLIGILGGGIAGLAVDIMIVRRFFDSARLVLTVVGIALIGLIPPLAASLIARLQLGPKPEEVASFAEATGNVSLELPFRGFIYKVGSLDLDFGFAHVFAIELAIVALLCLAAFFRYTRAGVAVRAMAENSDRALLLGISVPLLSSMVWVIAGMLSAAGVIANGALTNPAIASAFVPQAILPALVAAVIGRMRSLPVTVAAAVGLTVLQRAFFWSFPQRANLFQILLFAALLVALLLQRKRLLRSEAGGAESWQAVQEQRSIPKELNVVAGIRVAKVVLSLIAVALVIALPYVASISRINLASVVLIKAIAILSLVVLTGWAGQVSLGQWALVGLGAALGGSLMTNFGLPFWIAAPLAALGIAAVAVAVGLPALRVKGLFLAVTTLAFAFAVEAVLADDRFGTALRPASVDRPTLFFLNFDEPRSMYYLCAFSLAVSIVIVRNLRRNRLGRALVGLRENEANLQSFGISVVRMKLTAFGVSGALAGFAGALFATQQRAVSPEQFGAFESVTIFITSVIGGLGSTAGPLLGSLFNTLADEIFSNPILQAIVKGGSPLILLYVLPGGLIAGVNALRDGVLRIVAQRRGIVVPSLFADFDQSAIERKLIPLAEPGANAGLAALAFDEQFALGSELYTGNGQDVRERLGRGGDLVQRPALTSGAVG